MDNKDKQLDQALQQAAKQIKRQGPPDLWPKITAKLQQNPSQAKLNSDQTLDQALQQAAQNQTKKLPKNLWPSISKQLQLDKVWLNIESQLHQPNKTKPYFYTQQTTKLLTLLLLVLNQTLGPEPLNPQTQYNLQQAKLINTEAKINKKIQTKPNHQPSKTLSINPTTKPIPKPYPQTKIIQTNPYPKPNPEQKTQYHEPNPKPKPTTTQLAILASTPLNYPKSPQAKTQDYPKLDQQSQTKHSWQEKLYFGMRYACHWGLLDNQWTRNGLKSGSLIQTHIHQNHNIALSLGYEITPLSSIQANFWPQIQLHQSFNYYQQGRYRQKDLRFDYQQLDLGYRHLWWRKKNHYVHSQMGLSLARLRNQTTEVETIRLNQSNAYRTWNTNLFFELSQSFKLDSKTQILWGIQALWGLNNAINDQTTTNIDQSKIRSLGVFVQVQRRLR